MLILVFNFWCTAGISIPGIISNIGFCLTIWAFQWYSADPGQAFAQYGIVNTWSGPTWAGAPLAQGPLGPGSHLTPGPKSIFLDATRMVTFLGGVSWKRVILPALTC